jgi:hypothetical protein
MMILKPLLFKTLICICSFTLLACGGSGGSESVSNTSQIGSTTTNQPTIIADSNEQFELITESDQQLHPIDETIEDNYVDLQLNWTDNSNNEIEFIIERRIESNVDYGESYSVAQDETSYVDLQVQTGETYCYRISASNNSGSSPSPEVCIEV